MVEATVDRAKQVNAAEQVSAKPDIMAQLMKPEAQEALVVIIEQLPKLAEMMTLLTKTYDLASQVASDRVLIQDMVGGIKEMIQPVEEKAKQFAQNIMEANDRAEQSDEQIGVMGMLRMLKDPELQRMLRFGQAYLDIVGERKHK